MSVVVGCEKCGAIRQVERAGAGCKCGGSRRVLLDGEQNRERWSRGIGLEEWFAAPRAPARRADCARSVRPCPHVRCRHHLGVPGQRGCALDQAETVGDEPMPYAKVGALAGMSDERARQLVRDVIRGVAAACAPRDIA